MKYKVYEYKIYNKKVGTYIGSYTLKENCSKELELQKQFKSKLVDEFEIK